MRMWASSFYFESLVFLFAGGSATIAYKEPTTQSETKVALRKPPSAKPFPQFFTSKPHSNSTCEISTRAGGLDVEEGLWLAERSASEDLTQFQAERIRALIESIDSEADSSEF
jgi:hypothetical protein